jgi:arsenical pump membrane protein
VLAVALLVIGVAGALGRPWNAPAWLAPSLAAAVALLTGAVHHPAHLVRPLGNPIAFLLVAVPLAALLDHLGFFEAAAAKAGATENLARNLWILGALVTTVLNLDAAVVLLTPLYVRLARRCGLDPLTLAFQPVLLSGLASSALPVSNLTNLIVASSRHLGATDFLAHLGLPSLVATTVGWFAYKAVLHPAPPQAPLTQTPDARALTIGGLVIAAVLVGFVLGPSRGIPEWWVAGAADVILIAVTRHAPIKSIPVGTALVAGSLGLLAGGAAAHLPMKDLLNGASNLDLLKVTAVSALGANLVNNLPALLVGLPHVTTGIWALLLGVNMGPFILLTGTLAALLWQASLKGLGVPVTALRFAKTGAAVIIPSLAAATVTLIALRA